jgi:hypothetical protein
MLSLTTPPYKGGSVYLIWYVEWNEWRVVSTLFSIMLETLILYTACGKYCMGKGRKKEFIEKLANIV